MNKYPTHQFTPVTVTAAGNKTVRQSDIWAGEMFDAQTKACNMAVKNKCDIEHRVYNEALYRWEMLGTYHADGTCTDAFGDRRRFTGNKMTPWAKIEKGVRK